MRRRIPNGYRSKNTTKGLVASSTTNTGEVSLVGSLQWSTHTKLAHRGSLIRSTSKTICVLLILAATWSHASGQETKPRPRMVGYFPGWSGYGTQYSIADIPVGKLTHVVYAFAKIDEDGTLVAGDERLDVSGIRNQPGQFEQLRGIKQKHPSLKTLISVGGWTWSERFSDVAASTQSRKVFAKSAVEFLQSHGFDGIDLDWEFPVKGGDADNKHRPEDKQNFTKLVQQLRTQFDATGNEWLITVAAGAIPAHYENLELAKLSVSADWLNVMTYNLHGNWSSVTNFHTGLYPVKRDPNNGKVKDHAHVSAAIDAYLAAGVPPSKVVVGGAFYGRAFRGVLAKGDGLFQKFDGKSKKPSGIPFRKIEEFKSSEWKRHWNNEAKVPWLYNAKERVVIAYDNPRSLGEKARLIRSKKLGGMMFWSLSSDNKDHSLVNAVYDVLK